MKKLPINSHLSEKVYRLILKSVPVVTVDILFFNQKKTKILLFKRTGEPLKGVYFSVGGRLFKNETIINGAIRKVKQEVGIDIKKDELIFGGVRDEMLPTSVFKDINLHTVNIFYSCVLNKQKIILDAQHNDQRWFSIHDKSLHPLVVAKLKDALVRYHSKTP